MPFLTPVAPDIDPDEFVRRPFLERIRITSTFWAENGFGTPRMVHVIYLMKMVVFYTLGGVFLISFTLTSAGSASSAVVGRADRLAEGRRLDDAARGARPRRLLGPAAPATSSR